MIPPEVLAWKDLAKKHLVGQLTLNLILAMIWQESTGDPWQPRYEETFTWFYDWERGIALHDFSFSEQQNRRKALTILGPTEFHCQSMSWGLCQIMGAAARERGFRGGLPELATPECGLHYGIKHLWEFAYKRGKSSTVEALTRYNGSPIYTEKVLSKLVEVEKNVST